jgi:hypothetical protein
MRTLTLTIAALLTWSIDAMTRRQAKQFPRDAGVTDEQLRIPFPTVAIHHLS